MLRSVVNLIHYPKLHITTLDCCSGQFSGHYDSRVLTYKRRSNTRLATALVHCFTFVVGVLVCACVNSLTVVSQDDIEWSPVANLTDSPTTTGRESPFAHPLTTQFVRVKALSHACDLRSKLQRLGSQKCPLQNGLAYCVVAFV